MSSMESSLHNEFVGNIKKNVNSFNSIILIIIVLFVLIWLINDYIANIAFYIAIAMAVFFLSFMSFSKLKGDNKQMFYSSFNLFLPVFLLMVPIVFMIQSYINANIANVSNIKRIQYIRLFIAHAIPFQTALIVYYLYSIYNNTNNKDQGTLFLLVVFAISLSTSYVGWLYNNFLQNNLTDDKFIPS